jgi:hypothetical protein
MNEAECLAPSPSLARLERILYLGSRANLSNHVAGAAGVSR